MEVEWRKIHREKILAHVLRQVRSRVSSDAWRSFEQRLLRDIPAVEIAAELNITRDAIYVNSCRVMKKVRALARNSTRT